MVETHETFMLPGPKALANALHSVFAGRGRPLHMIPDLESLPTDANTVLLPLFWETDAGLDDLAATLMAPVDILKRDAQTLPRYLLLLCPAESDGHAALGRESVRTLLGYLTTHTRQTECRINGLLVPPDVAQSALRAAAALTSGLLDDVRGQFLTVSGGAT